MQSARFLSEFPPIETEQWESAIREGLSGPDYAEKFVWRPEEGLAIRPYYRAEDIEELPFLEATPGEFPYVRGTATAPGWRIREYVDIADPESANRRARELAHLGVDEIAFVRPAIQTSSHLALLLADLRIPLHFEGLSRQGVRTIFDLLQKNSYPASVSCGFDPLADPRFAIELLQAPQAAFRPFIISAEHFHERGAGSVEEVGFTLSAAADALSQMQEQGVSIDSVAQSMGFSFAIGPEFYIQIAKLRAFRMLWSQVVTAFGGGSASARPAVHARVAQWNQTACDSHVNILRSTTETMSAVLGGADSISVSAFDACYRDPDEKSRRLARNTQLILRQEAHFADVADAAGGSYLVETITNGIAGKAWKVFQELESAGGFQKAREAGIISSVLDHLGQSRQNSVNRRRLVLTGTNRFADALEELSGRVDQDLWRDSKRVSFGFESLRLRTERAVLKGARPRIALVEIGDAKMRIARSQFALEFLNCAGLSAERIRGAEGEAETCQANVLVLCSSDPEYISIAGELMPRLKAGGNRKIVLVAGNPAEREKLEALGVNGFIYIGCDAVAVLSKLQREIGMED